MDTTRQQRLAEFVGWTSQHIRGDEKGEAQIFLDRMFQAFGQPGVLEVGGQPEFRIRKGKEDGGGTAFGGKRLPTRLVPPEQWSMPMQLCVEEGCHLLEPSWTLGSDSNTSSPSR